ncbi:hypothetical protein ACFVTC_26340 [Streptomyces sp. NPDC057950]|uniref:hypothetical protein n=1 Tax=Streptomyces sp. NPDC057950 TaxID=3346288 RepID=UPI0036E81AE8
MSYVLSAVIGDAELLRGVSRAVPAARAAPLGQGLSLIPMTGALFDAVAEGGAGEALGFWRLPEGFPARLADWSTGGPLAYVEAEYFGGVGEQQAAVWDGGAIVLGPVQVRECEPFPPAGSPISQALRRLGVVADGDGDEFSAVKLGRHRHGDQWIA